MEITYLSKGLLNLNHLLSKDNQILHKHLQQMLLQKCLQIVKNNEGRFDPYSISKLMRYFSRSDESKDTLELYSHFTKQLITTLSERQISLLDADLDDPLVDLEVHDVIDIINVLAPLSRNTKEGSEHIVPKIFEKTDDQFQD